jgi:hypothetical protein
MTRTGSLLALVALAACAAVLAGPASGASASKASIRATLKSFTARVDVAEGEVLTALGKYKTTHEAAPVDAALGKSITVIKQLKTKLAAQSAPSPKVKLAKAKLIKGLSAVIAAYERLGTAFQDHGTNPSAAEAEAKAALVKVKTGQKQLKEAAKLLG